MSRQTDTFQKVMIAISCLLGLTGIFMGSCAHAQSPPNVPVTAAVNWTLPTLATDGSALTGPQALTKLQLFVAPATIPINVGGSPTVELPPAATSHAYSTTAPNGSTLFFRLRACNAGGCSALSNEATKTIQVAVPGVPTGVGVTVTIVIATP